LKGIKVPHQLTDNLFQEARPMSNNKAREPYSTIAITFPNSLLEIVKQKSITDERSVSFIITQIVREILQKEAK
jgi:hypothetical protein